MERYRNTSGESGIDSYETGDNYIRIRFSDGGTYEYTYQSTGKRKVEHMKALAQSGAGLCTYINTHVRKAYESKLK